MRLLLTVPASSAEAERIFSGLWRLKTWRKNAQLRDIGLSQIDVYFVHIFIYRSSPHKNISNKETLDQQQRDFGSATKRLFYFLFIMIVIFILITLLFLLRSKSDLELIILFCNKQERL